MIARVIGIIIAGFSTVFVAFSVRYSYGVLLPEMLSDLAISKTEAGIIYSSYFFIYTAFSPLLGLMVDRTDARYILTIFVAILGIGAYLMSFSNTVFQASIFFAIAGLGHSACWAPVVTVVMRWVSEKKRGLALSIVDLGSASGIAFWGMIIPAVIYSYSWRFVWIFLGITAFLTVILNFLFIRNSPPTKTELIKSKEDLKPQISIKSSFKSIFRDINFYLLGFSYLLISFSILIPLTFLTAYGTQELNLSYQAAASLIAIIGIAGAIGKLILGPVSDIIGRVRVMMMCSILTAVGGLGMAFAQGYIILLISTIIFGTGYGAIWPVYAASSRDLFSKDYSGSIVGLWTLYHGVGSVLAPVIAGWTIDVTGSYSWSFFLTIISATISLLLLRPLIGKAN